MKNESPLVSFIDNENTSENFTEDEFSFSLSEGDFSTSSDDSQDKTDSKGNLASTLLQWNEDKRFSIFSFDEELNEFSVRLKNQDFTFMSRVRTMPSEETIKDTVVLYKNGADSRELMIRFVLCTKPICPRCNKPTSSCTCQITEPEIGKSLFKSLRSPNMMTLRKRHCGVLQLKVQGVTMLDHRIGTPWISSSGFDLSSFMYELLRPQPYIPTKRVKCRSRVNDEEESSSNSTCRGEVDKSGLGSDDEKLLNHVDQLKVVSDAPEPAMAATDDQNECKNNDTSTFQTMYAKGPFLACFEQSKKPSCDVDVSDFDLTKITSSGKCNFTVFPNNAEEFWEDNAVTETDTKKRKRGKPSKFLTKTEVEKRNKKREENNRRLAQDFNRKKSEKLKILLRHNEKLEKFEEMMEESRDHLKETLEMLTYLLLREEQNSMMKEKNGMK